MTTRTIAAALTAATLAIGGIVWSSSRTPLVSAAAAASSTDLHVRNLDIAFYEKRAREDSSSAADFVQLAALYLQRAREAGDYEDFRRGERAARRSWTLRQRHNAKALHMLASALLAQHKFVVASAAADTLVTLDPSIVNWRGLRAELQLELGRYDEARASFDSLASYKRDLSVAPRLARWYEINGRNEDAMQLLNRTRDIALTRSDLPKEQRAWFFLRTSDIALRNGRLQEAEREAEKGLIINPGDIRLISLQAKVAFEKQRWEDVVELVTPILRRADISTVAMLGDAYMHIGGGGALAQNMYARVEQMAANNPEPFNRQWTQFRLDHGVKLPETLAILEREIKVRPDFLGWDQLAWAYHLAGWDADARVAIKQAMRMGTRDRRLLEHARVIGA